MTSQGPTSSGPARPARRFRKSPHVATKLGDVLAASEREKAAALAAKSYAAGDRRTPAQRAHRVRWERGRALRAELIAAGVLIPPGHDPAGGTNVLELDARGISEAALEIFFYSPAKEIAGFDMADEVIADPASDERVVYRLRAWAVARDLRRELVAAGERSEEIEHPAPEYTLPPGYEIDFFTWQRAQRAVTAIAAMASALKEGSETK